jgi:alkylated DNA repair dioxygenase AlkB
VSRAGNVLVPDYLTATDKATLGAWLATLHPLWEDRFPPGSKDQRRLLRPVYWLGNWQFACLGYYEPPRNTKDCAVRAEPFPAFLAAWVRDIEDRARAAFPPSHVPRAWHLNTCLVNFYGSRREGDRWVDAARVGEHRDREPGPVASLSVGARARFQFVRRGERDAPPVETVWLTDGSLQMFSGPHWKDALLHRVQRVEKTDATIGPAIEGFRTRRVNLTFRYVPDAHVVPFSELAPAARAHVRAYVQELARYSDFWAVSGADA